MKTILVTGGAGYIGSAATKKLIDSGYKVVVIDNLFKGVLGLVDSRAIFVKCDLMDRIALKKVFDSHDFDLVIHFAAYKDAGESMINPAKYSENITGSINLLDEIVSHRVSKIVFSSSAAVYGDPEYLPVDELHPTNPTNYYGFSKLKVEEIIKWYSNLNGLQYSILRYFNVAGDSGLFYVDPDAANIFPVLMNFLIGKTDKFVVYGNDYPTPDGTCVRDYIDINDLVDAHLKCVDLDSNEIINLGTSNGFSVLQIIDAVQSVTGKKINFEIGKRRSGDPAKLVANFDKAKKVLGWVPRVSLNEMIESMWRVYKALN
jgi:UDP-glucose 4-epimerase